jgi:hypothetical protein
MSEMCLTLTIWMEFYRNGCRRASHTTSAHNSGALRGSMHIAQILAGSNYNQ